MVKIIHLSYIENKTEILEDINTVFNDGEITGIIGESGSGKSVILKLIAGSLKKFSGEILLNNLPVKSITAKNTQRLTSHFINNKTNKIYDIADDSVYNFLMQSRKSFKKFLSPYTDFDVQITEEYIALFNLNEFRNKNVLTLSDGIFQKVILAFSFIRQADTLILDNPTNNLDLQSISLLQKALFKYAMNGNRTVIIACNDLNFLLQTADRILIMKKGRLEIDENPISIDSNVIRKYFNTEVLISRNIYNGRPNVHSSLKNEG